ncbi:hypothetical protein [Vacuolonema iberomarrocanum]|uniref:hypothetical protein n=1 Tax=Vacuolonema iberomarrocanum TaxID=3454632 RepID=UPI0019F88C3F|nr:hypothetical protein [filamentous cyanobacterium LEGE 07170]
MKIAWAISFLGIAIILLFGSLWIVLSILNKGSMGLISLSDDFINNLGGMGALIGFIISVFGVLMNLLHMALKALRGDL